MMTLESLFQKVGFIILISHVTIVSMNPDELIKPLRELTELTKYILQVRKRYIFHTRFSHCIF